MKIIAWSMSHWNNAEEFQSRLLGPLGLYAWCGRVNYAFSPVERWIACGTFSDPVLAGDLPVSVLNHGTETTLPYDCIWWNYSLCSWEIGYQTALARHDWDLLVNLDTDALLGDIDLDSIMREFLERPEELMTGAWCGSLAGGCLQAIKRSGVRRWLENRKRKNLITPNSQAMPLLPEHEATEIFKGLWWNPWPHIPDMRQDYGEQAAATLLDDEVMTFPMVRKPSPAVIDRWLQENSPQIKPVRYYAAP